MARDRCLAEQLRRIVQGASDAPVDLAEIKLEIELDLLGRDIGDLNVLADIAAEIGRDREAIVDFLNTDEGTAEVLKLEARAKASGVRSVPSIQIADDVISGAQPTGIIVQILKRSQAA